jgi:hypothetical protein
MKTKKTARLARISLVSLILFTSSQLTGGVVRALERQAIGDIRDGAGREGRSRTWLISQMKECKLDAAFYQFEAPCKHYYRDVVETSRSMIGKYTEEIRYSNGLRGWQQYCSNGKPHGHERREVAPGMVEGGPHGETFRDNADIEPMMCVPTPTSILPAYYKSREKCLQEGKCVRVNTSESERQLRWRRCQEVFRYISVRLRNKACGGYPIY